VARNTVEEGEQLSAEVRTQETQHFRIPQRGQVGGSVQSVIGLMRRRLTRERSAIAIHSSNIRQVCRLGPVQVNTKWIAGAEIVGNGTCCKALETLWINLQLQHEHYDGGSTIDANSSQPTKGDAPRQAQRCKNRRLSSIPRRYNRGTILIGNALLSWLLGFWMSARKA
jgi:hypothetical protein